MNRSLPQALSSFAKIYEKPMPQSPEAEMAVLGALILDPSVAAEVAVLIDQGSFYSEANGTIYAGLMKVYGESPSADMVELVNALQTQGVLEAVGGPDYIQKLATETPSAAGAGRYAKIVADKAALRALIDAADRMIYEALHGAEPSEVAAMAGEALAKAISHKHASDVDLVDAARRVIDSMQRQEVDRIPTGVAGFDDVFGGIPVVGVTTVIGVPSSGKSSLAAGIVQHSAINLIGSLRLVWRVFSFEMGPEKIAESMLAQASGVAIGNLRLRRQYPGPVEMLGLEQAMEAYTRGSIRFVEDNLTAAQIGTHCAMYAAQGVRGFVIDYAQNVPPSDAKQTPEERISECMRVAQTVSRQHRACVIVVSQPTAEAAREDRPLRAAEGKGSQAIHAASDMMLSVYRQCVNRPRESSESEIDWASRRTQAEIHVVKNKHGPVGYVPATFEPELTRFS